LNEAQPPATLSEFMEQRREFCQNWQGEIRESHRLIRL